MRHCGADRRRSALKRPRLQACFWGRFIPFKHVIGRNEWPIIVRRRNGALTSVRCLRHPTQSLECISKYYIF